MKLYQVSSNITTKLLAHYALNIEALASWGICVQNPGTICVRWVRDGDLETGRFKGQYNPLIRDYALTRSAAQPDELLSAIESNTQSFASDSALSFCEAEFFIEELFSKEEMTLLQDHLVRIGCNVEVSTIEIPVFMEEAVALLSDDPSQPFTITLSSPGVAEFTAIGVVDDDGVIGHWNFPDNTQKQ